jgi:acetylornithine deacetylase/succinyl-diaminopimelate desuccinylase-like protein
MDEAAKKRRHRNERIAAAVVIALVAAIAGGAFWYKLRETRSLEDLTYIPRKVDMTPEMELLREFVRIDTSTPAGSANGARWLAAQLQKRGIAAEIIESAPGRLNVYARVKGANRGDGLMLFNHLDVVAANAGEWTAPPFEGRVVGDQLYGRGVLDMKALTICQLLAFDDVAKSATPPARDLVFLATADEETGSEFGMRWLLAHRPDVFADVKYGITEGGLTELMREKMTYFGIEIGGKQLVELIASGSDVESLRRARFALEPYMFPREPERVLPEVEKYLRSVAPTRVAFRDYFADIRQTIRDGQFWRIPASYRDLTQNSVWATAPVRDANRWEMTVTLLNLPDEEPAKRIALVKKVVAPFGVAIAVKTQEGPVPLSPDDTPLFEILKKEGERRYKVPAGTQIAYRSFTDSRFVRPRGIVAYGVSPYPVDYFQSITIHGANERIRLQAFTEGIAYMRAVVSEWARGSR